MCGRYAVTADTPSLYGLFSLPEPEAEPDVEQPLPPPRYNIAPTDPVPVLLTRMDTDPDSEERTPRPSLEAMRWGLVPSWAKSTAIGSKMFNARAESVPDKPAFRCAFERRRALVPASGYYEWRRRDGSVQPFYITPADGSMMAFAGLWEFWRDAEGNPVRSTAVITSDAVGDLADIHDRMPLILPAADWDRWLDPAESGPLDLLTPPDPDLVAELELRPVSARVGSVRNDDPDLIRRVDPSGEEDQLTLM